MTTRLAVLGSPIAHSKSPALHRAAYDVLGLDWEYDAIEVQDGGLATFLDGLDASWLGLSLTMPLKREVLPLLDGRSPLAGEVGAANTVLLRDGRREGFNTDVSGIIGAFREAGVEALDSVQVLGAGATAASVLAAVSRLGASRVLVSARDPDRARKLEPLAERLGLRLTIRPLGVMDRSMIVPDALISTLPGGTPIDMAYPEEFRQQAVLFDVAYEPWPSTLATSWGDVGGTVISGLTMLLHQAVGQVKIFTTGDPSGDLPGEDDVATAMRAAVGL
ncbi:MAG: shikimate dehydrogenase [Pseudolysinimonas sp.]